MYSETKSDRFLGRQRDSDEFKKKLSINQYCQPSYMGSRFVVSQPELSLWALIFKSKQNLSNLSAFSDFSTQSKAKQHLPTWLTFLNPSESRCRPKNRSDYVSLYILQLCVSEIRDKEITIFTYFTFSMHMHGLGSFVKTELRLPLNELHQNIQVLR